MSKQVSLTACIAKMYEGGSLDRAGGTKTDSPMKKPSTSLSAMDNKLNLLDAKVEKILKSQGEVLKKLEVVYQGIGNLENGIAKLKPAKEPPSTGEDILKKGEPSLYNEIKALCTESVNLLKSLQQETNKQREKIDGIERSVSTADKVITFIGETFKSSKIVAYILKGTVPWRKGSLLENTEEVSLYGRLSGMSPFLGDNDTDTMNNILHGNCEFDSDSFENVSAEAKDFISRLLVSEKWFLLE
ncbi:UNVERIFIED_CONTAM: hypothetical protein FKN15_040909 [Acipenser sinensis]